MVYGFPSRRFIKHRFVPFRRKVRYHIFVPNLVAVGLGFPPEHYLTTYPTAMAFGATLASFFLEVGLPGCVWYLLLCRRCWYESRRRSRWRCWSCAAGGRMCVSGNYYESTLGCPANSSCG